MGVFEGGRTRSGRLTFETGGRRRVEDIMASVLAACGRGEKKTKIMYGSMLNLRQVNRYLETLLEKGLVMKDGETKEYRTTLRGSRYLKDYEDMVKNAREETSLHKELIDMLLDEVTSRKQGTRAGNGA